MTTDMSTVIIAKSDQLGADDLIGGPITITITRVEIRPGTEQPVSVFYEGDNGKPWKPCKTTARIMVLGWQTNDASKYVGRSLVLYRDPNVTWAGLAIGGVRISAMSHIDRAFMAPVLLAGRKKTLVEIKPLAAPPKQPAKPAVDLVEARQQAAMEGVASYKAWFTSQPKDVQRALVESGDHEKSKRIAEGVDAKNAPLADLQNDGFPGDAEVV